MTIAPVYFGGSPDLAMTAGQDLGGQRAVLQWPDGTARYADEGTPSEVLGVTTAAAAMGALASVRTSGMMTDPSFSWTPGEPVYLGAGGALTQTPPDAATAIIEIIIGTAVTDTTLLIRIRQPVYLLA